MPEELRDAAIEFWAQAGKLLNEILGGVARSLGLEEEKLVRFSGLGVVLGNEKVATMLRLFRYEGEGAKIVAEAHKDLGLLSLVIGDTPGLEVWNRHANRWFDIERRYSEPAASLLVGRQLERLSNGKYRAGGHRVVSYPSSYATQTNPKNYRYSIVFILRAHSPVEIDTDELTTSITGRFEKSLRGVTARELFREIKLGHFNINTGVKERDEQKRKLAVKKTARADAGADGPRNGNDESEK